MKQRQLKTQEKLKQNCNKLYDELKIPRDDAQLIKQR